MRTEGDGKYVEKSEGHWECRDCGTRIMARVVRHPVWDGPFPCSGSGRVTTSEEPYCPKCEPENAKPKRGAPIQVG